MGWGQRAEMREEIMEELAGQYAEVSQGRRDNNERSFTLELQQRKLNADLKVDREIFENQKNTVATEKALEEKSREFSDIESKTDIKKEQAELDIREIKLNAKESDMDAKLQRLRDLTEHAVELAKAEAKAEYVSATAELHKTVETAEAKADAKDIVIESQKGEISRLDELLKVTMGKLTQIDIKGLNIHIDAPSGSKGGSGKPEGKPTEKQS